MDIIYPHEGQAIILDTLFDDNSIWTTGRLYLFKNDITPTVNSVIADFTASDFTGFAYKAITRIFWTIVGGSGETPSYCYYADQTWTCTATPDPAQYAYGYYLTCLLGLTPKLMAACRFDTPILISNGNSITVSPRISLGDWEAS